MCGIVGYNGNQQAAPILLKGLEKLEYRGYDSAGLSVRNGTSDTEIVKAKGRLKALAEKTDDGKAMKGTIGIGHTRWATHGEPSEKNAHPHCSDDHNVIGVHNGIIENYQELKEKLLRHGYTFYSQTDTEVAVKLIDYYEKKYNQGPLYSLTHAMQRIRGSYALAVMFKDYPETIYAARKDSPMVIGIAEGASYLASDVTPILNYTKTVYYIGNEQVAELNKGSVKFFNLDQEEVEIEPKEVTWDAEAAEKNGYEHFMIKEIHEQPKAVKDTLKSVIKDGKIDLSEVGIDKETAEKSAEKAEMELKKLEDRREFLQPVMDNVSKEIKEYGMIKTFLPEATALERAVTYRDKKIKPLFIEMKNKIGAMAAQVKELTRERDKWKSKFQKKKQEHENTKKELAEVQKDYQKLSGEKEILQGIADRYNRLLRMLGKDMVERLVQDDIRMQAELEAKKQKEQMPKKISDRIPWAKEQSEEYNAQIKKNKAKYRGMEL